MKTLIYYGNHNLQKKPFTVSVEGSRSATNRDVQRLPIARGDGSSVVYTRLEEKEIEIQGNLQVDSANTEYDNLQDLVKNYDKIFADNDNHILRIVPNYESIISTTATAGWVATLNAQTVAVDNNNEQLEGGSIGFNIDSTLSTYNQAVLTWNGTSVNATSLTSWNFEFWFYCPDVYNLDTIEARIGSSASDYYSKTFTTNYEGKKISNGWNLLSIPLAQMAETGSVNDAAIDYFQLLIDLNGVIDEDCLVNGLMLVDESRVRNYDCYRVGEIVKEGNYFNNEFTRFSAKFINYTGYGKSTHYENLNTSTTITASTTVIDLDMDGSYLPRPRFTLALTTATNISEIEITNLENDQSINLIPTTVTAGDTVIFGGEDFQILKNGTILDFNGVIPEFNLGNNKTQIYISGIGDVYTPATLDEITENEYLPPQYDGGYNYSAQQFTAPNGYPITSFKVNAYFGSFWDGSPVDTLWYIYSDNSDSPNVALATATIPMATFGNAEERVVTGLNVPVTSGTKYWLVSKARYYTSAYVPGGNNRFEVVWNTTPTSTTYAGLSKSTSTTLTGGWVNTLPKDFQFQIIQSPSPAWNFDLTVDYKKLYL